MFAQYLIGLMTLLLSLSAASAQTLAEFNRGKQELIELKKKFEEDKKKEKKTTAEKFDGLIAGAKKNNRLGASERLSLATQWSKEKEAFLESDEIPADSDFAELGYRYGVRLNEKYKPVAKKYESLMKIALALKQDSLADELRTEKQKFDALHFPGHREFVGKSIWGGTRIDGNNSVRFQIFVLELNGEVFKAQIDNNHEVKGSINGLWITAQNTKQIEGQAKPFAYEGVVLGKTMILLVGRATDKGGWTSSYAVLRRFK